jgi:uncharacterized hydrophobic protein (TIGR00271 family)
MNKIKLKLQQYVNFIFIDKETRLSQFETSEDMEKSQEIYSSLSFQFLIMLTAASLISSLGLLSDSGVIIVGAMLIAPLMKPIMSLSYGISTGDSPLKLRSCISISVGVVLTIFVSYIAELTLQLSTITVEMENRIAPNLFDLGVAISAGIASAIALSRKSVADSLPGVAVAVAIVPPLCVAGISLSMGKMPAFYGAFLLFAVNLFAIVISAVSVFLLSGYGSIKNAFLTIPLIITMLVTLAFPLRESLVLIEDTDLAQSVLETWLHENYPENVSIHPSDLNNIDVVERPEHIFVFIELKSPENGLSQEQLTYLHDQLELNFEKPVNLKIQFLLTQELQKYSFTDKDPKNLIYGRDVLVPRK